MDAVSKSPKMSRSRGPVAPRRAGDLQLNSPEKVRSTVRSAAVIGRRHKNDFVSFIDFVKEAPRPYAVSAGGRLPILQPFDIRTEVRLVSELRVDVFSKLVLDPAEARSAGPGDVLLEGVCLKDPVPIQSSCPFSSWRPESLSVSAG